MRWHAHSLFTPGPRRRLSRDERRIWLARAQIHRRAGKITALHVEIGRVLLRRLGDDGRLDPSHETLAADAGCSSRTVRRALRRLADLGLLTWQRRLVRVPGWRSAQTSNAYALHLGDAPPAPPRRPACGGQAVRADSQVEKKEAREAAPVPAVAPVTPPWVLAYRARLAGLAIPALPSRNPRGGVSAWMSR